MTRVIETRTRTSSPAFVCDLLAGPVGGSLRLDDDADDDDADDDEPTTMTPTTTRLDSPMRPRCRRHGFCQPIRKHRQSWDNAQSLSRRGGATVGSILCALQWQRKKKLRRVFFNLQTKVFISLYRPNSGWGIGTPAAAGLQAKTALYQCQKRPSVRVKRDLVRVGTRLQAKTALSRLPPQA